MKKNKMTELIAQHSTTLIICWVTLLINIMICCIMYIKIDNKYAEAYNDLINYIESLLLLNKRQTDINGEMIWSINDIYKIIKLINGNTKW